MPLAAATERFPKSTEPIVAATLTGLDSAAPALGTGHCRLASAGAGHPRRLLAQAGWPALRLGPDGAAVGETINIAHPKRIIEATPAAAS